MARAQKRSKEYGYEVEVYFRRMLRDFFPRLERVGSLGYSKAHADLVQPGYGIWKKEEPIRIVATRDKRRTPLLTMSITDAAALATLTPGQRYDAGVVVQCKGRKTSTLGTLYQDLKEATR